MLMTSFGEVLLSCGTTDTAQPGFNPAVANTTATLVGKQTLVDCGTAGQLSAQRIASSYYPHQDAGSHLLTPV
jgi:hypothetical protein